MLQRKTEIRRKKSAQVVLLISKHPKVKPSATSARKIKASDKALTQLTKNNQRSQLQFFSKKKHSTLLSENN